MKKLTKDQLKQHTDLAAELRKAHEALDGVIRECNEAVANAHSKVEVFVNAFNNKVAEANAFVEAVHEDQQSFFDEKSEKWQEGDAGSAYQSWMDGWDLTLEEVELDEPSELETPDVDIESFDDLETECGS